MAVAPVSDSGFVSQNADYNKFIQQDPADKDTFLANLNDHGSASYDVLSLLKIMLE